VSKRIIALKTAKKAKNGCTSLPVCAFLVGGNGLGMPYLAYA